MANRSNETVTWVKPRYGVYMYDEDGAHPLVVRMNHHAKEWHRINAELEKQRKDSRPPVERYSVRVKWASETEFFFILKCVNMDEFEAYRRYWLSSPKPQKNIHSCRYYVKMDGSIVQSLRRGYKVLQTPLEPTDEEMDRFKATNEVPKKWLETWIIERLEAGFATDDK
jgi:hypothetical protein